MERAGVKSPWLWVIGGTSDGVTLATRLAAAGVPCVVTVTTEAARRGYPASQVLRVRVGALAAGDLTAFIRQEQIGAVLDASHPFAVAISQAAIAACQSLQLPYWRYQRPSLERSRSGTAVIAPDLDSVLTADHLAGQRVLLVLGYRWLEKFRPWQPRATLFARILPSPQALQAALAAGFTPDRLIALRPPIGAELEAALWRQWQITRVITKASGKAGGEDTKVQVGQTLGIPLTVIDRPPLDYPNCYQCHDQITAVGRRWWHSINHRPEIESIR